MAKRTWKYTDDFKIKTVKLSSKKERNDSGKDTGEVLWGNGHNCWPFCFGEHRNTSLCWVFYWYSINNVAILCHRIPVYIYILDPIWNQIPQSGTLANEWDSCFYANSSVGDYLFEIKFRKTLITAYIDKQQCSNRQPEILTLQHHNTLNYLG